MWKVIRCAEGNQWPNEFDESELQVLISYSAAGNFTLNKISCSIPGNLLVFSRSLSNACQLPAPPSSRFILIGTLPVIVGCNYWAKQHRAGRLRVKHNCITWDRQDTQRSKIQY